MFTLFDGTLEQNGEKITSLKIGAPSDHLLKKCRDLMHQSSESYLKSDNLDLLQYGPTQGHSDFRTELAKFLTEQYCDAVSADDLMVTAGASQGLALLAMLFFSPGDFAFVEDPTYFLAIKVLSEDLNMNVIGVPTDEDGINVEEFDKILTEHGVKDRPVTSAKPYGGLLYSVPTFNNPTGGSLPPRKCKELVEVLRKHNVLAICDDVYNCLPFVDSKPPFITPAPKRLFAFDSKTDPNYKQGNVVSNGSFSKLLGPGLRLGWLEFPERIRNPLVTCWYAESGGSFNQYMSCIVTAALKLGLVAKHVLEAREVYHSQMTTLCDAIDKYIPSATYQRPKGGYFVWLTFPLNVNCNDLQKICKEKYRVEFNPGSACSCTGSFANCMRLSFAFYEKDVLHEVVKSIGEAVKEMVNCA